MKTIDLGEWTCSYLDAGAGETIVLLHGFPLNKSMWTFQIDHLAQSHRVIAPDLRGHGESAVSEGIVTMRQMADDVSRLLDALNIDCRVRLCGLSMGGYVAWEFWRNHSNRLAKLILCDTRAVSDTDEIARGRRMMASQVVDTGVDFVADSMLPKLVSPKSCEDQPELVATLRRMILATDPQGIAAAQRGMAERIDMTPMLHDVTTPALLLCGTDDIISPPAEMSKISQSMPNALFVEIQGAGHLAPMEQPLATNEAIQRFLAS